MITPRPWKALLVGTLITAAIGTAVLCLSWSRWREHRVISPAIASLRHQDALVRVAAAKKLGKIGPPASRAVPALIEGLGDDDFNVRWRAADALGEMGPVAKAAVPALVRSLRDEDPFAAQAAAEALLKIDPSTVARSVME